MNAPKFGTANKIRKADDEVAAHQISETLKSIEIDLQSGRLDADEKTHAFHRITLDDHVSLEYLDRHFQMLGDDVPQPPKKLNDLSTESIGNLLLARLKAQGYLVYFDEKAIAATLEAARARLGGFLND